jgi:hypothetical protein
MNPAKCCVCKGVSDIRHEERGKDYCYKCWTKICEKKMKEEKETEKMEQGEGLYKWMRK